MIFLNRTLSDTVAEFNLYSVKRIVIADPDLGKTRLVGQYPIDAAELFACDVGAFLGVQVEILMEQIVIGRRLGEAAIQR